MMPRGIKSPTPRGLDAEGFMSPCPRLSLPFMRAVATDAAVLDYGDGRSCDLVARTGC